MTTKYYDFMSGKAKIKARMIKTSDNTVETLKNRISVINRPELKEDLFTIVGEENTFLGNIKGINKELVNDKELWTITTNMGEYKFEIVSKPSYDIVNNDEEVVGYLNKLLHKACDDILDNFVAGILTKDDITRNDMDKSTEDKKTEKFPWQVDEENIDSDLPPIPTFLKRNRI